MPPEAFTKSVLKSAVLLSHIAKTNGKVLKCMTAMSWGARTDEHS